MTTFLSGLILFQFGSGPVKGFAVTLCIGLVTTIFTAYFCTRRLARHSRSGAQDPYRLHLTGHAACSSSSHREPTSTSSATASTRSPRRSWSSCSASISLFVRGVNYGIDFAGGTLVQVKFTAAGLDHRHPLRAGEHLREGRRPCRTSAADGANEFIVRMLESDPRAEAGTAAAGRQRPRERFKGKSDFEVLRVESGRPACRARTYGSGRCSPFWPLRW